MADIAKQKRLREIGNRRWTDQETKLLLQHILDAIQKGNKFEYPTAQKFYKFYCTSDCLKTIPWKLIRYKMRHLKMKYLRAKRWSNQVGSELFKTDKTDIEARVKAICPYYDKLDIIFGNLQPDDPLNVHTKSANDYLSLKVINKDSAKFVIRNQCEEEDEDNNDNIEMIIPKKEIEDSFEIRNSTLQQISNQNCFENNETDETETNEEGEGEQINLSSKFDLERLKLAFERNKLKFEQKCHEEEMNWKRSQLNLDREKFELEKRRIWDEQHLRKYEIDKQFEFKKLEIEKDERLKKLEFKYKYKSYDEGGEFI